MVEVIAVIRTVLGQAVVLSDALESGYCGPYSHLSDCYDSGSCGTADTIGCSTDSGMVDRFGDTGCLNMARMTGSDMADCFDSTDGDRTNCSRLAACSSVDGIDCCGGAGSWLWYD